MIDLIGRTLGRYKIVEKIGEGGMGAVYKALQPSLNRYVAIKVLRPNLAANVEFVERFKREARSAGQLGHPNIIHINDEGQEGDLHYIVMAYVDGMSLSDKLRAEGALDLRETYAILAQVSAGLDYAHARHVIHRDVKPSNILLTKDGSAILTDFGIAKAATDTRITRTGIGVGTADYMSPEQCEGPDVDATSDIYSLGIVLYEMVTGRVPFQGENTLATMYQQVHEPPPSPSVLNPSLPRGVEKVIFKALQKDRKRRYRSAQEMVRGFQAALVKSGVSVATPVPVAIKGAPTVVGGSVVPGTRKSGSGALGRSMVAGLRESVKRLKGLFRSSDEVATEFHPTASVGSPKEASGGAGFFERVSAVIGGAGRLWIIATAVVLMALFVGARVLESRVPVTVTPTGTPATASSATPLAASTPSRTSSPSETPSPTEAPTRTATSTRTPAPTETPTKTPSPIGPLTIEPRELTLEGVGSAGFRRLSISGLSYSNGQLVLWGAVHMPSVRYADQYWRVLWVGDEVVGKCGIPVTDKRIEWWPTTGELWREDTAGVLARWEVTSDLPCVAHIKLVAKAGDAAEKVYATFDVGQIAPHCVR